MGTTNGSLVIGDKNGLQIGGMQVQNAPGGISQMAYVKKGFTLWLNGSVYSATFHPLTSE